MPRTTRIDIPGLLHHVIVRGIEKRDIFLDDDDRQDFLRRLTTLLEKTGTECLAWALIPNHFHLLLRPNGISLAGFMRRLLTGYAVTFNLRHQRAGHLFQNRYKSLVCEEEAYLLELIRYIHLNPLRAGLVGTMDALDQYPWCGHAVLMGRSELASQALAEVLARFGRNKTTAIKRYRAFVADGIALGKRHDLVGIGLLKGDGKLDGELRDSRVLGSGDFVEQILRQTEETDAGMVLSLERIMAEVATQFEISEGELRSKQRTAPLSDARSIICHLGYLAGHRGVDIARRLNITGAGATVAARRGREIIGMFPKLGALTDSQT